MGEGNEICFCGEMKLMVSPSFCFGILVCFYMPGTEFARGGVYRVGLINPEEVYTENLFVHA